MQQFQMPYRVQVFIAMQVVLVGNTQDWMRTKELLVCVLMCVCVYARDQYSQRNRMNGSVTMHTIGMCKRRHKQYDIAYCCIRQNNSAFCPISLHPIQYSVCRLRLPLKRTIQPVIARTIVQIPIPCNDFITLQMMIVYPNPSVPCSSC